MSSYAGSRQQQQQQLVGAPSRPRHHWFLIGLAGLVATGGVAVGIYMLVRMQGGASAADAFASVPKLPGSGKGGASGGGGSSGGKVTLSVGAFLGYCFLAVAVSALIFFFGSRTLAGRRIAGLERAVALSPILKGHADDAASALGEMQKLEGDFSDIKFASGWGRLIVGEPSAKVAEDLVRGAKGLVPGVKAGMERGKQRLGTFADDVVSAPGAAVADLRARGGRVAASIGGFFGGGGEITAEQEEEISRRMAENGFQDVDDGIPRRNSALAKRRGSTSSAGSQGSTKPGPENKRTSRRRSASSARPKADGEEDPDDDTEDEQQSAKP